jgi:hypothetical protein
MEPRTLTSAGAETVSETVERAKKMVSTSTSPDTTYSAPDVSKLESPAQPLSTPEPTTATVSPIEQFTTVTPEMLAERRALAEKQAAQGQVGQDLYEGLLGLGTKGQATVEAERAAGIPQLSTDLVDIENELAQKSLAFRRERERIETGVGLSASQKNANLAEVSRSQNRELADLEVIRAARSNSLTNAQNLVNRQIELEFGDKIAQIDALKFIYDENKESLTKEEDRLLQQTIRREERAFQVAADEYKTFQNEKNRYLINAAQAGADNNTLKTIQGAKSMEELYTMPGIQSFAMSAAERMSYALQAESLANVREERQARADAAALRLAAIESGQLLPEQAEVVDSIDSQFRSEPIVKEYNTAVAKKAGIDSILNSGVRGVEDIALVYEFMKSIDPTSVVREAEFDTASKSGNIFAGKFTKFNGYFKEGGGILPDNVRDTFRTSIYQSFNQKESQYFNLKTEFGEKVDRRLGITGGEEYLTQYDSASGVLSTDENGNIILPGRKSDNQFWSTSNYIK